MTDTTNPAPGGVLDYHEKQELGFIERLLLDRRLSWLNALVFFCAVISVGLAFFHIFTSAFGTPEGRSFRSVHLTVMQALAVLMYPLFRKSMRDPVIIPGDPRNALRAAGLAIDLILVGLVLFVQLWTIWDINAFHMRYGEKDLPDLIVGGILIFLVFEATRRAVGWAMVIITGFFMFHALNADKFFGFFYGPPVRWGKFVDTLFMSSDGIFGIPLYVCATYIILFIIFGAVLIRSGAGKFFIDLAVSLTGHKIGGPAKASAVASAFMGTVSGSAVANTASTGVITIPLMKANGFRPQFAGGVEAAASTGGQLMPPIMGAGAFVMASYTAIPYGTIVAVSVVPAILYFMSVAFIVRIEAVKYDAGSDIDMTVDRGKLLSGGLVFLIPLTVMIWLLLTGVTPSFAACWAIAALIVTSWATKLLAMLVPGGMFKPVTMGPQKIAEAFVSGIRAAAMTAVLLVTIGIMNNAIVTSGVGNSFSLMIAQWSQGSLVLAILLIALASLVLGMGLPVTAAYIILAILTAPALAGLMADTLIVDQLVQGISDPAKSALFILVDHPNVALVAEGMTRDQAWDLVAAIPFEIAVTIRPALVDPAIATTFLLTAHLIIFWLSQDSNVTPPVCLAAFTAAGIAGSRPMATGFESWKIAKGLYIVPLMFAYTPLISGSFWEVIQVGGFGLFGIYATNALIQRYCEGPIGIFEYIALISGAVLAFWPLELWANLAGAALILFAIYRSRIKARTPSAPGQPATGH